MIDIGVNLTNVAFRDDVEKVIQRAKDVSITAMIVTGTNPQESVQAAELCLQHAGFLYSTAGCHPHDASDFKDKDIDLLRELAKRPEVVALGECGLDFNRNYSPPEAQIKVFRQQLELACEVRLPVFLHQRDAHKQFCEILSEYRAGLTNAVVHCFTDGVAELEDYLDLDCYIGVTGWVCDERRGSQLQQAVPIIPENRLMLETDAPFLLPRNIKPKPAKRRNEPMYLPHVCEEVAKLKKIKADRVATNTEKNSRRFFQL